MPSKLRDKSKMENPLKRKEQAEKIAELTSSIYPQGQSWVMREWQLETGTEKLTRGLTLKSAKKKLKIWRKEKIEEDY